MQDLSIIIAANLAEIRKKRGLSLDKVSELSGVSKAMISQIERGDSNPTVATLWKIAIGLRVSFSELISQHQPQVEIVRAKDIRPVIDAAAGVMLYPLFPFEHDRRFEIFNVTLEPSASHASDPHEAGTEEYIILVEGVMEVVIDAAAYDLGAGDSLRCHSDKPHFYRNLSDKTVRFLDIIYYAGHKETPAASSSVKPAAPKRNNEHKGR